MNKILIGICCALLISVTTQLAAQDGKEWVRRMSNAYATASGVSMNFKVDYYSATSQITPASSSTGCVKYSGDNYYSEALGQITLVNKRYAVLIDKQEKNITCMKVDGSAKKESAVGRMDTSWNASTQVKLIATDGDVRKIEIVEQGGMYERTVLEINGVSNALQRVTYYYKALENNLKPRLVITYSDVRLNEKFSAADFSERKFIRKKQGRFIASAEWSEYRVTDLTTDSE